MRRRAALGLLCAAACSAPGGPPAEQQAAPAATRPGPPPEREPEPKLAVGEVFTLTEDGAWCWFQDERAIVDAEGPSGPTLLVASTSSRGDNDLLYMSLATGERGSVTLHRGFEADDHNVGALLQLPDGRYLTAYASHRRETVVHSHLSLAPHDPTRWTEESIFSPDGAKTTYTNLHALRDDQGTVRIFDFTRAVGRDPNVLELVDGQAPGGTWRHVGRLLNAPDRRPYLRYASDGATVQFLATDDHPMGSDRTIHHGIFDGEQVRDGFGTPVRTPLDASEPTLPSGLTPVFVGSDDEIPWIVDLEIGRRGHPIALLSTRRGAELHYHHARFDGNRWHVEHLAHAGTPLYEAQPDYSGLAALDPRDPGFVVISTNADPVTGEPLISGADGQRHWELFEGRSTDDGLTWTWTALTRDSRQDNLRPLIPHWDADRRLVLWMRGTYRTYREWDTQLVGLVQDR